MNYDSEELRYVHQFNLDLAELRQRKRSLILLKAFKAVIALGLLRLTSFSIEGTVSLILPNIICYITIIKTLLL